MHGWQDSGHSHFSDGIIHSIAQLVRPAGKAGTIAGRDAWPIRIAPSVARFATGDLSAPPEQKAMLDGIAQFGILLLLLLTGMETDLKLVSLER